MPLAIRDVDAVSGRNGDAGTQGDPGVFQGIIQGDPGGPGQAGDAARITRSTQSFFGDAGRDIVTFSFRADGGSGGSGGAGGAGANGVSTSLTQDGPTFRNSYTELGPNGDGGNGGSGGLAARGSILLQSLEFDLVTVPGGVDLLDFFGRATGGSGGASGLGGPGFTGGGYALITDQSGVPGNFFTRTVETIGKPGGISGLSAEARGGATGRVIFDDLTVLGERMFIRIEASGTGGNGAHGQAETTHGEGLTASNAHDGRSGGAGGVGLARLTDLTVTATGQLDLTIRLVADGGEAGWGGSGGFAAAGSISSIMRTFSTGLSSMGVGSGNLNTIYAEAGEGGDGGVGGRATAVMANARITGSADPILADFVTIDLRATGGDGGRAGGGGTGAASSTVVRGNPGDFLETFVVQGTPDGNAGTAGAAGASLVRLISSRIELNDGNDQLNLLFRADGDGLRSTIVTRNHFDGGLGRDTISLSNFSGDGLPSVVFNVQAGRVIFDGVGRNTMTGFETFRGGSRDDRFVDGIGNQTYSGGRGADRFVFSGGQAGDDRIEDFARGEDVIVFSGFGGPLNSFNDVLAAATQQPIGVLVQTSATSSVLLLGMQLGDLLATDFLF